MASGPSLQTLTHAECLEAMATEPVGRLAVPMPDGFPHVVPVNFQLDGDVVVVRTAPGAKLVNARRKVSFEVDHIDPVHHEGWSVLVRGTAYEATHWETDHISLEPWAGGEKTHWLRILPVEISGRRIALPGRDGASAGH